MQTIKKYLKQFTPKVCGEIYDLAREESLPIDAVDFQGDLLYISTYMGDWKHVHKYLDYLLTSKYNLIAISEQITEENGSDAYASVHIYTIDVG